MSISKIDCFTHIVPKNYLESLKTKVGTKSIVETVGGEVKSIESTRAIFDLDERFRIMDKYEGLLQIITSTGPPLDGMDPLIVYLKRRFGMKLKVLQT